MKRLVVLGVPALLVAVALVAAGASAGPRTVQVNATVKVLVNKDGWYRVPMGTLTGAGFTFPADLTLIHLQMNGADVPFQLHNGNLEFYGQALDTLNTDTRPYYLSVGASAGTPMSILRARAAAGSPTGSFQAVAEVRDRTRYLAPVQSHNAPGAQVGNNIFGGFVTSSAPVARQIDLGHNDTSQAATLRVYMYGFIGASHTINVAMNGGATLGSLTGSGVAPMVTTPDINLAGGTLNQGINTVNLSDPNAGDASSTDTYRITYQHTFTADNDALSFPVTAGTPIRVGGFSAANIRVVDITNPNSPRELLGTVSGGGPFTINVTPPAGATRLYAFVDSGSSVVTNASVVLDTPSTLKTTANQADLIVIAYKDASRDFIADVAPLVSLRQGEGLTVKVVNVTDVYDEFGNPLGAFGPDAIQSFIQYAAANWQNPKPKYVLLAGGATMDPRNYLSLGQPDAIPTMFFDAINPPEVGSDTALADTDGDGRPNLGIGRLPIYTDAQANALVTKIVNYSTGPTHSPTALLVADDFHLHDYCFGGDQSAQFGVPCPATPFSEDLAATSLVPNGVTVEKVYRSSATYPTDTDVHNAVIPRLGGTAGIFSGNIGPTLVNWFGHGAFQYWANANPKFLQATSGGLNEAQTLTNSSGLSVYMMMTCQTGYFTDPTFPGLAESLLYAPNGAVAAWASSGDTVPYDQVAAAKVAASDLFGASKARFGDAAVHAMSTISDPDVLHSWVLLGDPTMRLRIP